ncbi:MAG: hypothetical protein WC807_12605 [Hyphomicrobium sp.]|jgi:hypothetical protein
MPDDLKAPTGVDLVCRAAVIVAGAEHIASRMQMVPLFDALMLLVPITIALSIQERASQNTSPRN